MVFQSYALYPHMSVYDNMAFGLRLRGRPRPEIDRRVKEAAALLGSQAMNFIPGRLLAESDGVVSGQADGFNLRFPEAQWARLRPSTGRDVILGIRPEHIHHRGPTTENRDGVDATVSVVEMLGAGVNVHASVGEHEVIAAMEQAHAPRPGDNLQLVFDTDRLHVFDAETERALV